MPKSNYKILVLPDCQVKPGVNTDHLEHIGNYIAEKRPNAIVNLGDFYDMPSLSSYDKGKASAEGRRVHADIAAGNAGLARLSRPFANIRGYAPKMFILRGNHEERIERFVNDNPELGGSIGYHLFNDIELGWQPVPFLEVLTIKGVAFSHYFPRSGDGAISQAKRGAPSARAQVVREMRSCVAGHRQGLDTYIHHTGNRTIRGIIAGSCYTHQEKYLTPQGTNYWRGVLMLHEVHNGNFSLMEVTLDFLKNNYSKPRQDGNAKAARRRR